MFRNVRHDISKLLSNQTNSHSILCEVFLPTCAS